jgi:hypothetical protein
VVALIAAKRKGKGDAASYAQGYERLRLGQPGYSAALTPFEGGETSPFSVHRP